MKSYTDIEQSKKLAEILPHESADMYYEWPNKNVHFKDDKYSGMGFSCWSLSALLGVLSFPALRYDTEDGEGGWIVSCEKNDKMYLSYYRDSPVDTCYEMILKLHEQNLL